MNRLVNVLTVYFSFCVMLCACLFLSVSPAQIEKQGEFLEEGVRQWEELDRVAAPLSAFIKDLEEEIDSIGEFGSSFAECEEFQQKVEVCVMQWDVVECDPI